MDMESRGTKVGEMRGSVGTSTFILKLPSRKRKLTHNENRTLSRFKKLLRNRTTIEGSKDCYRKFWAASANFDLLGRAKGILHSHLSALNSSGPNRPDARRDTLGSKPLDRQQANSSMGAGSPEKRSSHQMMDQTPLKESFHNDRLEPPGNCPEGDVLTLPPGDNVRPLPTNHQDAVRIG
jgi:hypothetical protein